MPRIACRARLCASASAAGSPRPARGHQGQRSDRLAATVALIAAPAAAAAAVAAAPRVACANSVISSDWFFATFDEALPRVRWSGHQISTSTTPRRRRRGRCAAGAATRRTSRRCRRCGGWRGVPPASFSTVTVIRAPMAARFVFTPTSFSVIQSLPCPGFSNRRSACASPGVAPPTSNDDLLVAVVVEVGKRDAVALVQLAGARRRRDVDERLRRSRLRSSTLGTSDAYDGLPVPR